MSQHNPLDSQSIYQALRWSVAGKFASQLLSWAATILVIRLLSPADYGLIAMAAIVTGIVSLLNEAGLNEVIIKVKVLDEQIQREILALVLMINLTLFALVVFLAPSVAAHFNTPALAVVLPVLSLQFVFNALSTLPVSILERNLQLKPLSFIEWGAAAASALVSLCMAYLGYGYWALVGAALTGSLLRLCIALIVTKSVLIPSFTLSRLSIELNFAKYVLLNKLFWQLGTVVDDYLIARMLNKELLGSFAVAKNLSLLVLQKISPIIHQVTFPVFAREMLIEQRNELLLKGVWLLSIITFPLLTIMFFLADPLVLGLFGEQWVGVGQLVSVLIIALPIKILNNILGNVVSAAGAPHIRMKIQLYLLMLIASFVFMGIYIAGLLGAAIGWTLAHYVLLPIMFLHYNRALKLKLHELTAALTNNIFALLCMILCLLVAQVYITGIWQQIVILGGLGACSYLGATYVTNRSAIRKIINIMR